MVLVGNWAGAGGVTNCFVAGVQKCQARVDAIGLRFLASNLSFGVGAILRMGGSASGGAIPVLYQRLLEGDSIGDAVRFALSKEAEAANSSGNPAQVDLEGAWSWRVLGDPFLKVKIGK